MLSEREQLARLVEQWNENRLDLFHLSYPTEDLEIQGVMRFYFQDVGEKVSTKCIRVSSTATTRAVIDALVEKFLPDLKMLTNPEYSVWEVHEGGEERRLDPDEKPLLVQLTWHKDDREGRFLLKKHGNQYLPLSALQQHDATDCNINRTNKRFSKREKKEMKKKHQPNIVSVNAGREEQVLGTDLYKQVPPTTFTRTISNPEVVMKKRREKKLEAKLKEMGHGGSLKIYGAELVPSRPYVTLLVGLKDRANAILKEALEKYGLEHINPSEMVLVESLYSPDQRRSFSDLRMAGQVERVVDDDECPLLQIANRPPDASELFYAIRKRPQNHYNRISSVMGDDTRSIGSVRGGASDPAFLMLNPDGSLGPSERFLQVQTGVTEVGSDPSLPQFSQQNILIGGVCPRHCVITFMDGVVTVTPSATEAVIEVNNRRILQTAILNDGDMIRLGRDGLLRFVQSQSRFVALRPNAHLQTPQTVPAQMRSNNMLETTFDVDDTVVVCKNPIPSGHIAISRPVVAVTGQQKTVQRPQSTVPRTNLAAYGRSSSITSLHIKSMLSGSSMGSSSRQTSERMDGSPRLSEQSYDQLRQVGHVGSHGHLAQNGHTGPIGPISNGNQSQYAAPQVVVPAIQPQGPPMSIQIIDYRVWDFLMEVLTRGCEDCSSAFRLSPAFSLYLALRFFHSHSKPYLVQFMTRIATQISHISQESESREELLFWLSNASELSFLIENDGDLKPLAANRGGSIGPSVERVLRRLVAVIRRTIDATAQSVLDENIADEEATKEVIAVLNSTLRTARACRLNAALTIQLSSQLFHALNTRLFNTLVGATGQPPSLSQHFGERLIVRLGLITKWAELMGLELAAECQMDRIQQAANLLAAPKDDVAAMGSTCYKLNSVQIRHLFANYELSQNEETLDHEVIHSVVGLAERQADDLAIQEKEPVVLEESEVLSLPFILPTDGYAAEQIHGVPEGLQSYILQLQSKGLCHSVNINDTRAGWMLPQGIPQLNRQNDLSPLEHVDHVNETHADDRHRQMNGAYGSIHSVAMGSNFGDSIGSTSTGAPSMPQQSNDITRILIRRGKTGIGLSIVAAQGVGDHQIGIYVKKVVEGGPAAQDGRLAAGDQLLSVNGHSLMGISQEEAAKRMGQCGSELTFEVKKNAAHGNGLAAWLCQSTPTTPQSAVVPTPPPVTSQMPSTNYAHINKGTNGIAYTQRQQLAPSRSSAFSPLNQAAPFVQSQAVPPQQVPRHQRSISASDLYQNDPNASFSQRSICSTTSGFAAAAHQLPAHYRTSVSRPTVVQPGRSAQSPSALRRGAQSPNSLYRPPSVTALQRPPSTSDMYQQIRSHSPGQYGQLERPTQLGSQQSHDTFRQIMVPVTLQNSSNPTPVFRASSVSQLHTSPPVAQSSPRQNDIIKRDEYANLPLQTGQYQTLPTMRNNPNQSSTHTPQQTTFANERQYVPLSDYQGHQQPFSYTGGLGIQTTRLNKEPAVIRPLGSPASHPVSSDVDRISTIGAVPTAFAQAMSQGQGIRPMKPARAASSELERDVRQLEHTSSTIMVSQRTTTFSNRQDMSAELDRLDAKGINMSENETQRYRQLLDMNAERRQSSQPSTPSVRQETLIDDVITQTNNINMNLEQISPGRSALRENSAPFSPAARKTVQFSDVEGRDLEDVMVDSPAIVGAQEVYRDPRQRRLNEIQAKQGSAPSVDGSNLGFRDKMKLFASQLGENTPKDRYKESSAQRQIEHAE